jgi:hypothetical protein
VAAGQAPRLTPVVIDIKIIGGETMTRIVHAFTLGLLLNAGSALGLTVEAGVAGPLLKAESLRQLVKQKASGAVAAIPDIEQGGSHRLRVLVTTEYLAPSSYSYLVEMQLQRRVVEEGTRRAYWAAINTGSSWGSVPSETELRRIVGEMMDTRVATWAPD